MMDVPTKGKVLGRLRRIEGHHNPRVKQLRQAFSRAELTDSGDCAIEGLRILEEAIRSGLRFKRRTRGNFGIAQCGACFSGLHFAIAWRFREPGGHTRSSLRRAITHATVLVCADILLYNRDAPSILMRLDALVYFLLPRGLGYGLCAQLFSSLLSSS